MKLKDYNGSDVEIAADRVLMVEEYPPGQVMLTLEGGITVQVTETTVEKVRQLMREERCSK